MKQIKKQRIVFFDIHGFGIFFKTSTVLLFKTSVVSKQRYFLDYLLSRKDIEVCTYITENGFTLVKNAPKPLQQFLNLFRYIEHRYVLKKNNIPIKSIKIVKDINDDDILIVSPASILPEDIRNRSIFKAATMMHFIGTQGESKRLKSISPTILYHESDLMKFSKLFCNVFDWYKGRCIVSRFVAADRFNRITPFSSRKNLAISVGTITYRETPEYMENYGDACLQPMREEIFKHKEELSCLIDCCNSKYYEDDQCYKLTYDDCRLIRYYKLIYNMRHTGKQKKYFSFDMVERFNNFKMFIVGEETLGVPGIGFVEGMACGCAYIGQAIGFYEDYGMKEGVHYIGYDGTLDDLKSKIAYYQRPEHQKELERIANAGYEFAQTHFRGEIVAKELLEQLIQEQNKWRSSIQEKD